jgi:hypothetical protein
MTILLMMMAHHEHKKIPMAMMMAWPLFDLFDGYGSNNYDIDISGCLREMTPMIQIPFQWRR